MSETPLQTYYVIVDNSEEAEEVTATGCTITDSGILSFFNANDSADPTQVYASGYWRKIF